VVAIDSSSPDGEVSCGMTLVLRTRISEVLHYVWDPVVVSPEPRARDEYENLVPMVAQLLLERASRLTISSYLTSTAGGLGGRLDPERDRRVAGLLMDWHQVVSELFPRNC
jgi:hypothetical protein